MKKIALSVFCMTMFFTQKSFTQIDSSIQVSAKINLVIQTFKVWGNCESCKARIEKSIAVDGVNAAGWDPETKIMTVSYNPEIISIDQINKNIAGVGYDTETVQGDEKKYNKLPMCCKYDRKPE